MTQHDWEYRKIRGVVPQLDPFSEGHLEIQAPPIQYSIFTVPGSGIRINAGKLIQGGSGLLEGSLHMAGGNFGYGLGKLIGSAAQTFTGVYNGNYAAINRQICDAIRQEEDASWKERVFLAEFVPAQGYLGQIVCGDGEYSNEYTGCGHRFFENGDYFEGLFYEGRISDGVYIFANGARYYGMFDSDLHFVATGLMMYADGSCYYGNFEQSRRNGFGICWYKDMAYIGQWYNDMRHGQGSLKMADGKFYDGAFFNDQMAE